MMNSNTEYAKLLRAIGQDLEKLHVQKFEMESDGNDYIVRGRAKADPPEESGGESLPKGGLRTFWSGLRTQRQDQVDHDVAATPSYKTLELRYTPDDLNRLEHEGQAKRRDPNQMPNTSSASQVLRATGAYVNDTSSRLLGVIWQNQSVRIMYETALGSQEVDEIEVSSMYDFCMHMYRHRDKRRHFSDIHG
jgi:hypothetical protein